MQGELGKILRMLKWILNLQNENFLHFVIEGREKDIRVLSVDPNMVSQ